MNVYLVYQTPDNFVSREEFQATEKQMDNYIKKLKKDGCKSIGAYW